MPDVIQQTVKAEHVLGAAIMFVHPTNGNRYYGVCEKQGGTDQNFVVYRRKPGQVDFEFIYQLDGAGRDATAFITMGGAVINLDGSLELWASGQPTGQLDTSGTGFDAIGAIVPNVDEPWAFPKAVKAAPVPAHVKLNPPAGFRAYGANQGFALSAEVVDGLPVYFLSQEGWGYSADNSGFGHYVFKQVGERKAEYMRYNGADVMDGRGDLYIAGNGKLYVTGNESDNDKLPSVYEVPGYVPFGSVVTFIGSGAPAAGGTSDPALAAQVASLAQQLAQVQAQAKAALERANYVKGVFDPVWGRLDAVEKRPVGISRDDAWQLAADRMYAEVSNEQSGVSGAIKALVAKLVPTAAQPIDLAPLAGRVASVETALKDRPTFNDVAELLRKWFDAQWQAWVAYTDKRLLNLIWDRSVKLLRYKETSGKSAAQLPVNDPKNLEV